MKRILLCTDGSTIASYSYDYGAWLAQHLDASIDVLHVSDTRRQAQEKAVNLSGSIGIDASDRLLEQLVNLEHQTARLEYQQAQLMLQSAVATLQASGVEQVRTLHKTGYFIDILSDLEPGVDMVVLGKRGTSAGSASEHLGGNLERIIRASHKPCLTISRPFQPIERVLLAYDDSPSARQVLNFVLTSPLFRGLELHILKATPSQATLDRAQSRLDLARQQAEAAGFSPICQLVVDNPETAISNAVAEGHIDLLAIGAYGHRRLRHLILGSTTAQILRSSQIPVLIFR